MDKQEFLEKVKSCQSVEEFKKLAEENGINLKDENGNDILENAVAKARESLSDEELNNIAGGINSDLIWRAIDNGLYSELMDKWYDMWNPFL